MSALEEIEQLHAEMSRAEKAQVLQWVVRDLGDAFPGIESRPDINGGEPCIVRTRIPVCVLLQARQLGASEANLLRDYPTLHAEDLIRKGSAMCSATGSAMTRKGPTSGSRSSPIYKHAAWRISSLPVSTA